METRKFAAPMPGASPSAIPQVTITPSPAPGKRGPAGTSPRQNNSVVNTGVPTPSSVGLDSKMVSPSTANMLPQKSALSPPQVPQFKQAEVYMGSMAARPTVQDMLKAAMAGAVDRSDVSREANRQAENLGEKVASASPKVEKVAAYDRALQLADAVEFIADELSKEANTTPKVEVGKGPGALQVLEAKATGSIKEDMGHSHHPVPMHPGLEKKLPQEQSANSMATNMDSPAGFHGHQQASMVNQKGSKVASIRDAARMAHESAKAHPGATHFLTGVAGLSGGAALQRHADKKKKEASGVVAAIRNLSKVASKDEEKKDDDKAEKKETEGMSEVAKGLEKAEKAHESEKKASLAAALRGAMTKAAEDAINPAHISAGPAVAPDTRASGESGGPSPSGASMVASNESATNYTKGQAKATPKADMKAYVQEPALTSSTDSALSAAFAHTGEAGTKMSSANGSVKTAAARELLTKIAAAAAEKAA